MKKILYILLVTITLGFATTSCTEEKVEPTNARPSSGGGGGAGGSSDLK